MPIYEEAEREKIVLTHRYGTLEDFGRVRGLTGRVRGLTGRVRGFTGRVRGHTGECVVSL